jgi:ribosomal protein L21
MWAEKVARIKIAVDFLERSRSGQEWVGIRKPKKRQNSRRMKGSTQKYLRVLKDCRELIIFDE